MEDNEIIFQESTISKIIRDYTYEAGVRNLEREIGRELARKIARIKIRKQEFSKKIGIVLGLRNYLVPHSFSRLRPKKRMKLAFLQQWHGLKMVETLCRWRYW